MIIPLVTNPTGGTIAVKRYLYLLWISYHVCISSIYQSVLCIYVCGYVHVCHTHTTYLLHTYICINNMLHYPLPGYVEEKVGHLTCFDAKTCSIHGKFNHSLYSCMKVCYTKNFNDQNPIFCCIFWVGRRLGFDWLAFPIVGAFNIAWFKSPPFPYITRKGSSEE